MLTPILDTRNIDMYHLVPFALAALIFAAPMLSETSAPPRTSADLADVRSSGPLTKQRRWLEGSGAATYEHGSDIA